MSLSTMWTSHLKTQEDKDGFTNTVYNHSNDVVLMRLRSIIQRAIESCETAERSVKAYDVPNWAYLQADSNGSIRALKQLDDLLGFVKESK